MSHDDKTIPTEAVADIIYRLTRHGAITTHHAAEVVGYSHSGVHKALNKASRRIPITNVGNGHWIVTDEVADLKERTIHTIETLRRHVAETPRGVAFCKPLSRSDAVALLNLIEALLR